MGEDYDTVPVVGAVGLDIRAVVFDGEAVAGDAVSVDQCVADGFGAALREGHVVFRSTGVAVGVTDDCDFFFGVGLHPFGHVVDVNLFGRHDFVAVDGEAYSSHERSVHAVFLNGSFGAWELGIEVVDCGVGGEELAAEVVYLVVGGGELCHVVAVVEFTELTAAEVDVETADALYVGLDGVAVRAEVPVVAVECGACFSEEVYIFEVRRLRSQV